MPNIKEELKVLKNQESLKNTTDFTLISDVKDKKTNNQTKNHPKIIVIVMILFVRYKFRRIFFL